MDDARARELLAEARERIETSLSDLRRGDQEEEQADAESPSGDEGSDLNDRQFDAGLVQRLEDELAGVERAEERLAAGTYGLSVESGDPIPDARLEANPTAERTVEEQSRLERGG